MNLVVLKLGAVVMMAISLMLARYTGTASSSSTSTRTTTAIHITALPQVRITPTALAGVDGYLWLAGTYPCATGTCSALMRSADGGNSWVRVGSPPAAGDSLEFANREDGYAYGASPSLYWTGDGGKTWHLGLAQVRQVRPATAVISGGHAYALVPEDCLVDGECKSLNLASSAVTSNIWRTRRLPLTFGELNAPVGLASYGSKLWVITTSGAGGKAAVVVSGDGGNSFVNLPSTGMGGLACYAAATSLTTLWGFCATGSLGYAVRSTDGGRMFAVLPGRRDAANSGVILPLSDTEAVYSPVPSYLYVTRDGGTHFSYQMGEPAGPVLEIAFASLTTWVVLGFPESGTNVMWRTTSGGNSWQPVEAPSV